MSNVENMPELSGGHSSFWQAVCAAAGGVALLLVGLGLADMILFAVLCGQILFLSACFAIVGVVWLLTRLVRLIWFRILFRAFTVAAVLWPFIPHGSIQWSSPFPPAGYWVLTSLLSGRVLAFELMSILAGTVVMWTAGLAVHNHRRLRSKANKQVTEQSESSDIKADR